MPNVAFLVVSCDKYKDLWPIFFQTFFKYWNECQYKIYLASNFEQYEDGRINNISFGIDSDYSSNLNNIINQIKEDWIIVWYEDAFITKKVDNQLVTNIVNEAVNNNLDYLKLTVDFPLYYGKPNQNFGPIPRGVKYRSAMGMALYHRKTLDKILIPGLSAWQLDKSTDSEKLDCEFYALNSKYRFNRPFEIINSVVKGKWQRSTPAFLSKEGLSNLIPSRQKQSIIDYLYIKLYLLRVELYFLFQIYWKN